MGYNASLLPSRPCLAAEVDLTYHATNAGFLSRHGLSVAFCLFIALNIVGVKLAAEEALSPRPTMEHAIGPFVQAYCIDCHTGDSAEAGLDFDKLLSAPSVPHRRLQWQRAVERIAAGEMPPPDTTQPEGAARDAALAWLREELADPDCSLPQHAGESSIRRLNRTEYQNTIRDLLGVEFDAAKVFPRDELGFGFDNNGDILRLPPVLLEKYLQAAETIAERAIVSPESISEPMQQFAWRDLEGGDAGARGVRGLFSNGAIWADTPLQGPGEYLVRVKAFASQAGAEPTKMRISAGEKELATVNVTGESSDDPQTYVARFHGEQGLSKISVEMTNDAWEPWAEDPNRRDRNLFVMGIDVVGPTDALTSDKLPVSHRKLLAGAPTEEQWRTADGWIDATRGLLDRFLSRSYRRPPAAKEVDRFLALVAEAHDRGDSFERSMQLVLQAALASPQFLFISDEAPDLGKQIAVDSSATNAQTPASRPIGEFELAARLSYFFWSSMPDDELLQLAGEGKLRQQLDAQIDRLLASPRADQLIRNFSEQWLETRRLESMERSPQHFPDYDEALRDSFREETFRLVQDVVRNNRPLSTLLSADYSFINGRLAKHYGLAEPTGDEFVRVSMPAERRAGILGHGSVLSVTAFEDRTSPVLRGKWVLDHLLADPPPPPPPDAGSLPDASGDLSHKTLRERLELHRADPTCASCHKRMDPIGLAMENFDAVGRWRDREGDQPIDSSGELPDGRKLNGPASLRDVLLEDFARVRRSLAERLLIYGLGRGLEPYDTCAVNEVVAAADANGDTFASMVRAVAKSTPFQLRTAEIE